MRRRRTFGRAAFGAAVALLVGSASCDSGPKAGDITAELATTHQQLGAAMFQVKAVSPHTIDGISPACNGCEAFMSRVSDTEVRGIVTGPFGAGALVYVSVSDRGAREAYSIQLLELARTDYGLAALTGSSLQFPTR